MKKLFDQLDLTDLRISTEMIDYQHNDNIIPELEKHFSDLIDYYKNMSPANTSHFVNNKEVRGILDNIDEAIFKRFGFKIRHVGSNSGNYGIFTAPPLNYNVLFKENEQYYDIIKSGVYGYGIKTPTDINTIEKDQSSVFTRLAKSMELIEKQLNTKGLKINLKTAKITGLPLDYYLFVIANFEFLIGKLNLSPIQMVAILLHEIGHGFTHIEYSYKTVVNTNIIFETVKEQVGRKNKSLKDSLILGYKKVFGNGNDEFKNMNSTEVVINVSNIFIRDCVGMSSNPHGGTDSEQIADQFVGRFGLTAELADALKLVNADNSELKQTMLMLGNIYLVFFIYVWILVLLSGMPLYTGLVTGLSISLVGVVYFLLATLIISIIYGLLTGGGLSVPSTYDDVKRRITRIKNELLRSIKDCEFTTDEAKHILEQLDSLDGIINSLPDDKVNFINSFFQKYTTKGKRLLELKNIEELIEDLQANPLYASSLKLKTIGENK